MNIKPLNTQEKLNEFLNKNNFDFNKVKINYVIILFNVEKHENVTRSTGYRIIKKWRDEQKRLQQQNLNEIISRSLLEIV